MDGVQRKTNKMWCDMINLFTIGFTKKSAERFFYLLISNKVERIIDTRINNSSQLSGFAKAVDLKYFAKTIGNINYLYRPDFAPTNELVKKYRNKEISWPEYEIEYLNLLDSRKIAQKVNVEELHQSCLLCSEHTPENCHRRLLAEYFQKLNNNVKIVHLM